MPSNPTGAAVNLSYDQHASKWCPHCRRRVLALPLIGAVWPAHLALTLFSCGLWGPVWLVLFLMGTHRCSRCGTKV